MDLRVAATSLRLWNNSLESSSRVNLEVLNRMACPNRTKLVSDRYILRGQTVASTYLPMKKKRALMEVSARLM